MVLIVLLGIGSGVALTAFAGARRTDDAVSQFVRYSLPDDGGFLFGKFPPHRSHPDWLWVHSPWLRRSSASSTSHRSSPMRVRLIFLSRPAAMAALKATSTSSGSPTQT